MKLVYFAPSERTSRPLSLVKSLPALGNFAAVSLLDIGNQSRQGNDSRKNTGEFAEDSKFAKAHKGLVARNQKGAITGNGGETR